ncbi:hypothetical protein K501DRAFT_52879 [Backusella circina FSU 941]|nr:hypothetical protein K501DRAFT_52879 [Backusella circina FSU 941]
MSQNTADMPLEPMAQPTAYPTTESMTTANAKAPEQIPEESNNAESGSILLRLRGGAGCITDCLAAIGCCCLCEECCC